MPEAGIYVLTKRDFCDADAFAIPALANLITLYAKYSNALNMADVEMTTDEQSTKTVSSIEVEEQPTNKAKSSEPPEEKQETAGAPEGSDNENDNDHDAPGDNDDEGIEVTDLTDGKISSDLYKAFKAITEALLNYKIQLRGNE